MTMCETCKAGNHLAQDCDWAARSCTCQHRTERQIEFERIEALGKVPIIEMDQVTGKSLTVTELIDFVPPPSWGSGGVIVPRETIKYNSPPPQPPVRKPKKISNRRVWRRRA